MPRKAPSGTAVVDWLTVVAISAIAISLNVALHEGAHALACLATGGRLEEFSALYVSCASRSMLQGKMVSGAGPFYNLLAGALLWLVVRKSRRLSPRTWYFAWLFMLMNLLYGSGYFVFSGVTNVGDMAAVIRGWQPGWLWRAVMTVAGSLLFVFFVQLALRELGRVVGGEPGAQIRRANRLALLSYLTSIGVVVAAGLFNPLGVLSLPVTAGVFAVSGALSPLLWMMQWFRAEAFVKLDRQPLEIHRSWGWIAASLVVVVGYVFLLGRTLYF